MENTLLQVELLKSSQNGDLDALDKLLDIARSRLVDYAKRTTLDENLAEDVVQDSLLAMHRVLAEISSIEHFWGWLFTTLNFKLKRALRNKWGEPGPIGEDEKKIEDKKRPNGIEKMVKDELLEAVVDAMCELSPLDRAILSMKAYEQLSFREISERLSCKVIAARIGFWRAKKRLAVNLATRGFSKVLIPFALVLFGKLTASSKAAAGSISVPAGALKAGVVGTTIGVATTKTAIVAMGVAGAVTIGTVALNTNNAVDKVTAPATKPITLSSVQAAKADQGSLVRSHFYPNSSQEAVLTKIVRCDENGQVLLCEWLQNEWGNYHFDADKNTLYKTNYHYWSKDGSVFQLPTDGHAFREFIAGVEGKEHDYGEMTVRQSMIKGNLLIEAKTSKDITGYSVPSVHRNIVLEENWTFDWEEGTRQVDLRDQMHMQGWACFTIDGRINGKQVTGNGELPLVYAEYDKHRPWLKINIGDKSYTDYNTETLFKGLSRPWQGLHTIDTIRRDAAQLRMPFETAINEDGTIATVTVNASDVIMVYTIDMEEDLLTKITLTGEIDGEITFTYMDSLEAKKPRSNQLPSEQSTSGLKWLVELAK